MPVVQAQPIQFADNPLAREIQTSVPPPAVITQPVYRLAVAPEPTPTRVAVRKRVGTEEPAQAREPDEQPRADQPLRDESDLARYLTTRPE